MRILFIEFLVLFCVCFLLFDSIADILPTNVVAVPETKEFLSKVIDILLDYIRTQNDRNERVLEFHHPEEMLRLMDLDLPETALPLQQLIQDCAATLKYQVRTGKCNLAESVAISSPSHIATHGNE